MKKLISHLLICFAFLSCSKDSANDTNTIVDNADYYVRFKSNGSLFEFKSVAEGTYNKTEGSWNTTAISGIKEASVTNKNFLLINFATLGESQMGTTYTNFTTSESGSAKALNALIVFYDDQGGFGRTFADDFPAVLPSQVERNCKIKVTEATTSYVKGIFSGALYSNDYSVTFVLTEGEFFIKRKP